MSGAPNTGWPLPSPHQLHSCVLETAEVVRAAAALLTACLEAHPEVLQPQPDGQAGQAGEQQLWRAGGWAHCPAFYSPAHAYAHALRHFATVSAAQQEVMVHWLRCWKPPVIPGVTLPTPSPEQQRELRKFRRAQTAPKLWSATTRMVAACEAALRLSAKLLLPAAPDIMAAAQGHQRDAGGRLILPPVSAINLQHALQGVPRILSACRAALEEAAGGQPASAAAAPATAPAAAAATPAAAAAGRRSGGSRPGMPACLDLKDPGAAKALRAVAALSATLCKQAHVAAAAHGDELAALAAAGAEPPHNTAGSNAQMAASWVAFGLQQAGVLASLCFEHLPQPTERDCRQGFAGYR
ncbi:hypothetical protein ABPG75_011108 [Micractinium tetrahymenae]